MANKKKIKLDKTDPYYLLKADFKNFLFVVWQYLGLPKPTKRQYELADYLQDPNTNKKMILAFRGIGKSWICATFVVWTLWRNRNEKCLIVSATEDRAIAFSIFCKQLLHLVPFLNHLIPEDNQRNSNLGFDVAGCNVAQAPSVKTVGIMGQLTGARATLIIFDDVEIPSNSETEEKREKLLARILEAECLKVPEGFEIIFLGTPQNCESIYGKLQGSGYKPIILPARYVSEQEKGKYSGCLAKSVEDAPETLAGQSTDPQRFTTEYLLETEGSMGKTAFALQFMLDTSLSDALKYPLHLSDLIVLNVTCDKAPVSVAWTSDRSYILRNYPNLGMTGDCFRKPLFVDDTWKEYEGIIMAVDPSGKGNNQTAYAVIGSLHGVLYLLDVGGFLDGYSENTLTGLALIAKRNKVNGMVIEPNYGSGMFTELMKPILDKIYRCALIEGDWNSAQKEKRIIGALEPVMNRHKLVIAEDVVARECKIIQENPESKYCLFKQMTRLTHDKGCLAIDDKVDVLAMGVEYWIKAVGRDDKEEKKRLQEEARVKMLDDFVSGITGRKTSDKTCLDRRK